jgi:hypothetical protein
MLKAQHEHKAGNQLLSYHFGLLHSAVDVVNVIGGWPPNKKVVAGANVIVFGVGEGEGEGKGKGVGGGGDGRAMSSIIT